MHNINKKIENKSFFLKDFSLRLRKLREINNLSCNDLANILGLSSPSQISRYENGQNMPDIFSLSKISMALKVDLNWLITGQNAPSNNSMRSNYIKSLSLLNSAIHSTITQEYKTIEDFQKIVDDIEKKQKEGMPLTDIEKHDLDYYSAQITFLNTLLEGHLEDQAWASKAMNDVLSKNKTE